MGEADHDFRRTAARDCDLRGQRIEVRADGVLVVLDPHAGEHPRELALEAAAACPAQSLRVY